MSFGALDDQRPAVWVGHIALGVSDVESSVAFFKKLGMRDLKRGMDVGILELRGGTHLVLLPSSDQVRPGTPVPFDLMVDDVEAAHRFCTENGMDPSEMEDSQIHRSFTLQAPSGHVVTVNSTHASGEPV